MFAHGYYEAMGDDYFTDKLPGDLAEVWPLQQDLEAPAQIADLEGKSAILISFGGARCCVDERLFNISPDALVVCERCGPDLAMVAEINCV